MTKEEMRIAIAESCGYRWKPPENTIHPSKLRWWIQPWDKESEHGYPDITIPDYTADLNSIHEAVVYELEGQDRFEFDYHLGAIVRDALPELESDDIERSFLELNATALQRCEAFCKVKGIWKEESQ